MWFMQQRSKSDPVYGPGLQEEKKLCSIPNSFPGKECRSPGMCKPVILLIVRSRDVQASDPSDGEVQGYASQ